MSSPPLSAFAAGRLREELALVDGSQVDPEDTPCVLEAVWARVRLKDRAPRRENPAPEVAVELTVDMSAPVTFELGTFWFLLAETVNKPSLVVDLLCEGKRTLKFWRYSVISARALAEKIKSIPCPVERRVRVVAYANPTALRPALKELS